MIGFILIVALIGSSIASGLGAISAWWILVVALIDALWGIATGPMYAFVSRGFREGKLHVFPRILAMQTLARLLPASLIYGISSIFS